MRLRTFAKWSINIKEVSSLSLSLSLSLVRPSRFLSVCLFKHFLESISNRWSKQDGTILYEKRITFRVFQRYLYYPAETLCCRLLRSNVNGHGETYFITDIGTWKMRSAGFTSGLRLSFPRVTIYDHSILANCQEPRKTFHADSWELRWFKMQKQVVKSQLMYTQSAHCNKKKKIYIYIYLLLLILWFSRAKNGEKCDTW